MGDVRSKVQQDIQVASCLLLDLLLYLPRCLCLRMFLDYSTVSLSSSDSIS
jgi:hypothetical protein